MLLVSERSEVVLQAVTVANKLPVKIIDRIIDSSQLNHRALKFSDFKMVTPLLGEHQLDMVRYQNDFLPFKTIIIGDSNLSWDHDCRVLYYPLRAGRPGREDDR